MNRGWGIRARAALAVLAVAAALAAAPLASIAQAPTSGPAEQVRSIQDRVTGMADRLVEATVGLQMGNRGGSGVLISADGYILTAAHVSGKAGTPVDIYLHNGRRLRGVALGLDATTDCGLVKAEGDGLPFLPCGKSADVAAGDWVVATGHPLGIQPGRPPVVRIGKVVAIGPGRVQTDCPLISGDSGGPLFNLEGEVIGINSAISGSLDMNYHGPVDNATRMLDTFKQSIEISGSPYLGVRSEALEAEKCETLGIPGGVVVLMVAKGSGAEQAGLQEEDIVLSIDGTPITDPDKLTDVVLGKNAGQKVKAKILRGGERLEVEVTLGSRADGSPPMRAALTGRQLNRADRRQGTGARAEFASACAAARRSVVTIVVDEREVGLGVVVSADGFVATKASLLAGAVEAVLPDGREVRARVVGKDPEHDVALLKVAAERLVPIAWADESSLDIGQWLVSPGIDATPLAYGVMSTPLRPIGLRVGGFMGIQGEDLPKEEAEKLGIDIGCKIVQVVTDSPAAQGGIKVGDVLLALDGESIDGLGGLRELLAAREVGRKVDVRVLREGERVELTVTLGKPPAMPDPGNNPRSRMMNGNVSEMRGPFPQVIQHDSPLTPNQVGGPLVTLDGACVGMNVARGGRVETYAIPAKVLRTVIDDLKKSYVASAEDEPVAPRPKKWY